MEKLEHDPGELARWCHGKITLVVGVGGGADILLVKAMACLLEAGDSKPARVLLANTKGTKRYRHLEPVEGCFHVGRVDRDYSPGQARLARAHGTIRIDALVRCADEGGPFIFQLPVEEDQVGGDDLAAEIRDLGVEAVLAVDGGGDALTEPWGRDGRMLEVLRQTGLPLRLLVVAPGCDGQTHYAPLLAVMAGCQKRGEYLGWFHVEAVLPEIRHLAGLLPKTSHKRVVQIIIDAYDRTLGEDRDSGRAIVPREEWPDIPWEWLTRVFVMAC